MVSGIVRNEHHAFSGNPAGLGQLFEKKQKSLAVEFPLFPAENEFAVAQPHRAVAAPMPLTPRTCPTIARVRVTWCVTVGEGAPFPSVSDLGEF